MEHTQSPCPKYSAPIRSFLSFTLVFILLSAFSAPRLTLTITPSLQSIGESEPVVVNLQLASDDGQPVQVLDTTILEHYPYSFSITDGGGTEVPFLGPDLSINYFDSMFTTLSRGESVSHQIDLRTDALGEKLYDFSKPGIYTIRATYRSPGDRYRIPSNTISLTIR